MTKFILLNVVAASLYITPIILTKKMCYECTSKDSGTAEQSWVAVEGDKEESKNVSMGMCLKSSQKPKECEIVNCSKKSSGC